MREMTNKRMEKPFLICSVCREDVADTIRKLDTRKLTMEQARKRALLLSDAAMEYLAEKMSDAFSNTDAYSQALEIWVEEELMK